MGLWLRQSTWRRTTRLSESIPGKMSIRRGIVKIAIAYDGDEVSGHFGHCEGYALFAVENGRIAIREDLPNPGHEPGRLPALLRDHGVTHVIVGGMGPKAVDLFCANSIEVYLGIRGPVQTAIRDFLDGSLAPGQSSCHHTHECGH